MSAAILSSTAPPAFLLFTGEPRNAATAAYEWAHAGFSVRIVRGYKMRRVQGQFDEFAAALQFPWYFGENPNAFDDCIRDLSWLPAGSGYVIVVLGAESVLAQEDSAPLGWLVGSLADAAAEFSTVDSARGSTPFHVVLQAGKADERAVRARWAAAGAEIASVE